MAVKYSKSNKAKLDSMEFDVWKTGHMLYNFTFTVKSKTKWWTKKP